ncbi:MAG: hypothetical protein Q4B51_03925 [Coriobacteriaceae bacterium]|nr:hypothetical protein [Coriobacteriaceae bacterium]
MGCYNENAGMVLIRVVLPREGGASMSDLSFISEVCDCASCAFSFFTVILVLKEHGLFEDIRFRLKRSEIGKRKTLKDDLVEK